MSRIVLLLSDTNIPIPLPKAVMKKFYSYYSIKSILNQMKI